MRGLAALLVLAGSLTAVLGAGRTWLAVQLQDPVLGSTEALLAGSSVAGTATAAGLLGAAAGLVSVLTRGVPRRVGLALALVAGGWQVWIGSAVLLDPAAAARTAALPGPAGSSLTSGTQTGSAALTGVDPTVWPAIVALAGLLVVCGVVTGGLSDLRATSASASGTRTPGPARGPRDEPQATPQEQERRRATRAWEALSAGADPTDDEAPPSRNPRGAGPEDS
ncbi:MAG: Trp biosynthesis-associated membrane protein [Ornithinimicrobium sp.]|uniref:Trp biosynthesis-associated membrane protein n=1 Tax=Ornithinimicrobium sp. TaxID=1977084 RepID=UPI003D9B09CD